MQLILFVNRKAAASLFMYMVQMSLQTEENPEQTESELKVARVKWSASCKWILNDNASSAFDRSVLDK